MSSGDVPSNEGAAAALFAELGARTLLRPSFIVASLEVLRGGATRRLVLRMHVRGPGHVLVQVKEPARAPADRREHGTVLLLHEGRVHAWFPRAELSLAVPALLVGTRLFGSDLSLDHLLALAGDTSTWRAVALDEAALGDERCQRLRLLPRADGPQAAPAGTSHAALELLLARGPGGELLPRQIEGFDAAGMLVSRVRLEGASRSGLPESWTAWTLPLTAPADGADRSALRITLFERDPPVAATDFLPEALPRWR